MQNRERLGRFLFSYTTSLSLLSLYCLFFSFSINGLLRLNFSFLTISLIHILMLILGIKAKVSGGTLLAGIGLLIFEILVTILLESEKLVLACIPLIVFCFGELVEFLSTKKEDNRKFGGNLTLNLITKILITLQAVILTLEHD